MPRTRPTTPDEEPAPGGQWTVGEMARLAKCTLRAVRFYEQQGLLCAVERTEGRHRRYSSVQVDRLRTIIDLRRAGMTLDAIRRVLDVQRRQPTGAAAAVELSRILEDQMLALGERLSQIHRIKWGLENLHQAIQACRDCCDSRFPRACVACERSPVAASNDSVFRALWSHSK